MQPGLITYSQTADLDRKASIIAELLSAPYKLFQKPRGNPGKALISLNRRMNRPAAAAAIFPEYRHVRASPLAPVRAPDIEMWVDGSAGHKDDGDRAGETGIGVVVLDHKSGPPTVSHRAYLGTGTNNTAEVSALIYALELYKGAPHLLLHIYSDSKYALGAAGTDKIRRQHLDLVLHLRGLIAKRNPRAVLMKVKAHAGNTGNEAADKEAGLARTEKSPLPRAGSFLASRAPAPPPPSLPRPLAPLAPSSIIPYLVTLPHLRSAQSQPFASLSSSSSSAPHIVEPFPSQPLSSLRPSLPSPSAPPVVVHAAARLRKLASVIDAATARRSSVRRATTHVRQGHIGAAVQALSRPPLPELTEERFANLLALHPQRDPKDVIQDIVELATIPPQLDPPAIMKLLKRCDSGKAAGPSNLTAAHLLVLASDPDCLRGICDIIRDIIEGNLGPAAVDLLTAAVSVATDKGGDQVRPLAVPEILYKVAAMLLLESINPFIPALFPTIQLGCGVKGGTEQAIHRTQLALELGGAASDTVVLSLDFRNAFNERRRSVMAKAIFAAPSTSRLWKFFMTMYGNRASHLGIYHRGELIEHFLNTEGVKQGDPLASFLYALSVQSLYTATIAGDDKLEAVAIADDFTITGPSDRVIAALRRLIDFCAADGPTLNPTKCKALWAYSKQHVNYDAFLGAMNELRIPIFYDSIPLLGASVGIGMHRAAHCMKAAKGLAPFLASLTHQDMPAQVALHILRECGLPILDYLGRVTPPTIFREAAECADEQIANCVASILDLPSPGGNPIIQLAIDLPFRSGGMGFPRKTRRSPFAFFSSYALTAFDIIHGRTGIGTSNRPAFASLIRDTDTHFHLADTWDVLRAAGIDPEAKETKRYFPPSFSEFWPFFAGKRPPKPDLQHRLTTVGDFQFYIRQDADHVLPSTMLPPLDDEHPSRPGSAVRDTIPLLYTSRPTSHSTNLSTRDLRYAVRHHLRLPVAKYLPDVCICGGSPITDPSHFHSCKYNKKVGNYHRHEVVADDLCAHARRAGVIVRREPAMRDEHGRRKVPDITLQCHTGPVLIDVSICCAFAKSNLKSSNPIAARERQKTNRYESIARDNGAIFIPFVLDSMGRFGNGAWQVLDLILTQHANNAIDPDPHLHDKMVRSVAIQLQRGNALVEAAALIYNPQPRPAPRHPLAPPLPPPPPITHDTLRQRPASPDLIPSLRAPFSSSSSRTSSTPFSDPNLLIDGESKQERLPPIGDGDSKRSPALSSSSASSSSSSSSLQARTRIDVYPHTAPNHIVDSSIALTLSSSSSFALLGPPPPLLSLLKQLPAPAPDG